MGAPVASGTLAGSTSGSWASIHEGAASSDFSRFGRHPSGRPTRTTLSTVAGSDRAVGCTEPTIPGSPGVTAARWARLLEPWLCDDAGLRRRTIAFRRRPRLALAGTEQALAPALAAKQVRRPVAHTPGWPASRPGAQMANRRTSPPMRLSPALAIPRVPRSAAAARQPGDRRVARRQSSRRVCSFLTETLRRAERYGRSSCERQRERFRLCGCAVTGFRRCRRVGRAR